MIKMNIVDEFKFKPKGIFDILDNKETAFNYLIVEQKELDKLNLNKIITVEFPDNQYIREQSIKNQIVLHHTVSGQGVDGDINWWRKTTDRIGTSIIIGWDGKIYQCFSTKYWAYHLGLHRNNNKILNKQSIGVEIDSWGGLVELGGKWYPAKWDEVANKMVANTNIKPIKNVQIYNEKYRGFYGFEKYTDEQIEAVRKLLVFWGETYNIPLNYNEDIWDVSNEALSGKKGIWSHVSFREDKSDCHPQNELIEMLKSLT